MRTRHVPAALCSTRRNCRCCARCATRPSWPLGRPAARQKQRATLLADASPCGGRFLDYCFGVPSPAGASLPSSRAFLVSALRSARVLVDFGVEAAASGAVSPAGASPPSLRAFCVSALRSMRVLVDLVSSLAAGVPSPAGVRVPSLRAFCVSALRSARVFGADAPEAASSAAKAALDSTAATAAARRDRAGFILIRNLLVVWNGGTNLSDLSKEPSRSRRRALIKSGCLRWFWHRCERGYA